MVASGELTREERGGWSNKLDFLFSCIGYAVGLGNVWRFPYLVYKNGGGAFLIPYGISVLTCGIPFFLMEVTLGQYFGLTNVQALEKVAPIFKGVGLAVQMILFHSNIAYTVIIGWALFYLIAPLLNVPKIPWDTCGGWWNTEKCYDAADWTSEEAFELSRNVTMNMSKSPVEEYWDHRVLQITDGLDNPGGMQWELVVCVGLAWLLIYVVVWRGLQNSGKIIWVTAMFPYVMLIILFARAITLPGASDGIYFYLKPDFSRLADPVTWLDGGSQVFYSYGLGYGTLFALGSYNKFNHNCYRDTMILAVVNSGTSFFAGFVIFSSLGYMAHVKGVDVSDVVASGPGLVFLAYPEVIRKLSVSPLWAVLFFMMLTTLGIDSMFSCLDGFVSTLCDIKPVLHRHKRKLLAGWALIFFMLELPLVTRGGIYLFTLEEYYGSASITLLMMALFQATAYVWIWGADNIVACMKEMTGIELGWWWKFCWKFAGPGYMSFIFLFFCLNYETVRYNHYEYPVWGQVLGGLIAFSSLIWVPAYAIYFLIKQKKPLREAWRMGTTATLVTARTEKADQPDGTTMEMSSGVENGKPGHGETKPEPGDHVEMRLGADGVTCVINGHNQQQSNPQKGGPVDV